MTAARTAGAARRTLHVVDADNLTAGPTEHQCVADRAARLYRTAANVRDGDLVVVGSDLRSAAVTAFAWAGARLLRTTGTDAVDHLLLDDLVPSLVVGRVERVVVGSGDGIFATRLAQLRAAGVRVEVVARPGRCRGGSSRPPTTSAGSRRPRAAPTRRAGSRSAGCRCGWPPEGRPTRALQVQSDPRGLLGAEHPVERRREAA